MKDYFVIMNMVRGGLMKETRSLKVLLVAIIIICALYNVFLGMILSRFNVYDFENIFFIIRYAHHNDPEHMKFIPQFLNWIFVVSFIFFSVLLFIRIYINKEMKVKNRLKDK